MRSRGSDFQIVLESVFGAFNKGTPLSTLEAQIIQNKQIEPPEKELLLGMLRDHAEPRMLKQTITTLLASLATFQASTDDSIKIKLEVIYNPLIIELNALLHQLSVDNTQHKALTKKFETTLIKTQDAIKLLMPSNTIVDSHFFHSRLTNIDPLAEKLTKLNNLFRETLSDPPEISTAFRIQK